MSCLNPEIMLNLGGVAVLGLLVIVAGAFFCILAWKN